MSDEKFISRWARLKAESRQTEMGSPVPDLPKAAPSRSDGVGLPPPTNEAPLPPLDELKGLVSEYGQFLKPGVDENLRRAALKKLFLDPHFNVMDGLDVYIDDYSKEDPISQEMLKTLAHARDLLFKEAEPVAHEAPDASPPPADLPTQEPPDAVNEASAGPEDAGSASGVADDSRSG